MTTTEDNVEATESTPVDPTSNGTTENTEAPAAVKYPTYRDLAFATWKLAARLAYVDGEFCTEGANEYLEAFGLPDLVHTDGNVELQDKYLNAWFDFKHWSVTDEDVANDTYLRNQLARAIPLRLRRNEPKSRATMNRWLEELGLDLIEEPNHIGRYNVEHRANVTVNSEMITRALNAMFPEVGARVSYDRRIQ